MTALTKLNYEISPSAALLFAKNEFKIAGLEAFEKALEQLRLLYPNSYLSREAIQTLKVINLQSEKAANSDSAKNRTSLVMDVSKMTLRGAELNFMSRLSKIAQGSELFSEGLHRTIRFTDHTLVAVLHRFFDSLLHPGIYRQQC